MASKTVESIVYRGITFRRYPDAKRWPDRYYFTPNGGHRKQGVGRLHEEIWKDTNGPIPDGYEIHHVDFDAANNDPANLHCITAAEHREIHRQRQSERGKSPEQVAHLRTIQPLTAEWHRSDEGREWHREYGRKTWEQREPVVKQCEQCDSSFTDITRRASSRFCSNKCKSAWRRASGADDEDRTCAVCGTTFRANRYSKQRACSTACGGRLQSATKTGSL